MLKMHNPTNPRIFILKYVYLLIIAQIITHTQTQTQTQSKCCQSYDKTNSFCLTCPLASILSGNNCIIAIEGCQQYLDCFSCGLCADGYKLVDGQFNGQKVKTCQDNTVYLEIDLVNPASQGEQGDTYLIVDDYFRTLHP